MKHLFRINSSITYLMARAVINAAHLNISDCIMIRERHFEINAPEPCRQIRPVLPLGADGDFSVRKRCWRIRSNMRAVDAWLSEITDGDEFTAYMNKTGSAPLFLIVTHPQCAGYYYLEEGTASYDVSYASLPPEPSSPLKDLIYGLLLSRRMPRLRPFYDDALPNYLGCYASNELALSFLGKRQVIPLFSGLPADELADAPYEGHLLVMESIVEAGLAGIEDYLNALSKLFAFWESNGVGNVCYKWHPAQEETKSKARIRALLNKARINFEELPAAALLEKTTRLGKCTVYVSSSSVGLYALLFHCRVVSFLNFFEDKRFLEWVGTSLPPFMASGMEYLHRTP